jgi:hypothetical protein
MDCWIVIGAANYKISPPDPIGLPLISGFSTLPAPTPDHARFET